MSCPINKLYTDFEDIKTYLLNNKQLDYLNVVERQFTKSLLVSSASLIEDNMQTILIEFIESVSTHEVLTNFLKNKAISRQYHTYFDWKGKNANNFLGLFGVNFRDTLKIKIKEQKMEDNIKAFLELGRLRNELVHQNFILHTTNKTTKEIKNLFDKSYLFLDFFKNELNNYSTKE